MKTKGFLSFVLEALVAFAVVLVVLCLCDHKRVFASDELNNHTGKKWHYLYQYSAEKKPIDMLIVGNSHAYTGILPEIIQKQLNMRSFILAAPGVTMDECSYMLEEALQIISPKIVVLETFPINGYVQKELDGQMLSDQYASFENRRDWKIKLKSSWKLFSLDNMPMAWSSTLRNHDILFDNPGLLKHNLKNPQAPKYDPKEEYLGRYVRFKNGLTPETLKRYEEEGAPVDGSSIRPGPDAANATQRMVDMCQQKDIPVMFLTIPMYHEHVIGAREWHENLKPLIGKTPWLDLQLPNYDSSFSPDCFEDTYNVNQHLTGKGAGRATQILTAFIKRYTRRR